MAERRIKYIEVSPQKRELVFDNSEEWGEFFQKYFSKIVDEHGLHGYQGKWKYEKFKLKKDGTRAGSNDGSCLQTPEARKKQVIAWEKYIEKRREKSKKVRQNKERIISKVNNFLKEEGYHFKFLSGGYFALKTNK